MLGSHAWAVKGIPGRMSSVRLDKGPGNKAVSGYPGSVAKGMFLLKLPNSLFPPTCPSPVKVGIPNGRLAWKI